MVSRGKAMVKQMLEVLGLGEWLWDMLPQGPRAGGAPYNLAFQAHAMGHPAAIVSRVGDDDMGRELANLAADAGINLSCAQVDPRFPTGKVLVEKMPDNEPAYNILAPAAWDFLEPDETILQAASTARAIVFGTLASRNHVTRQTVRHILDGAPRAARVFDVNLRQAFHSPELITDLLACSNWLKVNTAELEHIAKVSAVDGPDNLTLAKALLQKHQLDLVAVTDAGNGAMLVTGSGAWRVEGHPVSGGDPVGAGDAFTAGLLTRYLEGAPPEKMLAFANALAACVAGEVGGTPSIARSRVESLADRLPIHVLGR